MDLAAFSIRNRLIMYIVVALSLFAGGLAYQNMPRFEDPEFTIRTAQIFTPYPGGTPAEVAEEVSAPLEEALQDMPEVKEVRSLSTDGFSELSVEIKYSESATKEELRQVWTRLRSQISDAAGELPPGAGPSLVFDDFGDVFGIYYLLTGEGFTMAELRSHARDLRQDLLAVPGVGKVNIAGEQDEVIYVEISRESLVSLGRTAGAIFQQLSAQNTVVGGGSVEIDGTRLSITPTGDIDSVEAIENLQVASDEGRIVKLGNIAKVTRGYREPSQFMLHYDGKPALAIGVAAISGSNVVAIGDGINKKLEEVSSERPLGMELQKFYHQSEVVEKSVNDFVINVVIALVIVIGTLFVFMGPRAGMVIGVGLLLTIAATLGTMYMINVPMHRISLGALIIALGMLVDNAIVVTDGILVGMHKGRKLAEMASEVVRKSVWPLLGGTLVGILAFAPVGLAPGDVAEFTGDLFWVILISLLFSWVFAITLTPFLCDLLLKAPDRALVRDEEIEPESNLMHRYKDLVRILLRRRFATIGVVFGLLALTIPGFNLITPGFFPASTTPQMVVDFWMPEGTDIATTNERLARLEEFVSEQDGVNNVQRIVGRGTLRYMLIYEFESSNSAYGQLLIKLDDYDRLDQLIPLVQSYANANHPDAQTRVKRFILGPGGGSKIEATFSGPDPAVLRDLADQAKQVYRDDGRAIFIHDDWREQVRAIEPRYSDVRGRRAGVSRGDVGDALSRNYLGQPVGVYRENDDLIPIISRAPLIERQNVEGIGSVQVQSASGQFVPLGQVTDGIDTVWRDGRVRRKDKSWSIKAQADPVPGEIAGDLQDRVGPKIEAIPLPPGYSLEWDGERGKSEEANVELAGAIPYGFGAMVLVVVLLFNAVKQPLVIWSVVPLAMIGVVFGLLVAGVPFEFMAILGVLSLAGLLIKNAIVLVDQIDLEIREGKQRFEAIIDSAASRVRPVLLGSGTTVLGVIPLFFDAFFKSMAVVLVFGLSFATVLTLLILPVVYASVFGIEEESDGSASSQNGNELDTVELPA